MQISATPSARVGVIGCGRRIQSLLKTLFRNHASAPIQVAALCDPNPVSISETQSLLKSPAKVFENYRELAESPGVDWVMVGSWNCFHRDHAVAALNAGKNVFCEKPLATTLQDCLDIRNAVLANPRSKFLFGFCLRYSPFYRRLASMVHGGAIGQIISMEFNETLGFNHGGYIMGCWRKEVKNSGTHLLEKCCHDIDIVNWIVGSSLTKAASFGGTNFFNPNNQLHVDRIGKNETGRLAYQTWNGTDENPFHSKKDIADNQVCILEYANQVRATFHTNLNAGIPERRMYLLGTEGSIRADAVTGLIEYEPIGFGKKREQFDTGFAGGHSGGDEILVNDMVGSMLQGETPKIGIQEALAAAITCFAIDQAHASNSVIDARPLWSKAGVNFDNPSRNNFNQSSHIPPEKALLIS